MNLLAHAIKFASEAHEFQIDKNGLPYILHPLRVMMRVQETGLTETYLIVAVLHDVVEDTPVTLESIGQKYGPRVTRAVDALTRRTGGPTGESYKKYIERCCKDPMARIIKKFDVQDNMDPKRYHPDVPYKRYIWTLQYLQELKEAEMEAALLARHRAEHGVVS